MHLPTRTRPQPPIRLEWLEDRTTPAVIFTETFDTTAVGAVPTGWTATGFSIFGNPVANWGVDTTTSTRPPLPVSDGASGQSVYVDEARRAVRDLDSPVIALPNAPGLQLRFRHNYTVLPTFSGGVLEISIPGVAGGAFLDILSAGGKFASGEYTGPIIAGRLAWTGTSGGFVTTLVNLPAAAQGMSVQFRWRMSSNDLVSFGGGGWRVDTVQVATPTLSLDSGNNQSVRITGAFTAPLAVKLVDGFGGGLAGQNVTFTAPGGGASATFPNGNTATTDASGVASVPVQANGTAGAFQVTATVTGVGTVRFNLLNTPNQLPITVTAGGPYIFTPGGSLSFAGSATDPDGDSLLYSWDLNGDGTFGDAVGPFGTLGPAALSALGIVGGFTTTNARVRVTDPFGSVESAPTIVCVVPPTPVRLTAAAAGPGGGPHVKVYDADGSERFNFFAYDPGFTGGVNVATGDVTGDLVEDIVTAAGAGGGPHVRVFDGVTGLLVREFFAYDPGFTGGVNVAVGDVNGDGYWDVVTATGAGGAPHVQVFSGRDGGVLRSFFAYDSGFTGGVSVAAADLTGDCKADIVTGAGAGGAPHVRAFDGGTLQVVTDFFAFDPTFPGGVNVAAGDLDVDFKAEIFVGQASCGSRLTAYRGANGGVLYDGDVYDGAYTGVRVAVRELNDSGRLGLVVGSGADRGSDVRVLRLDGSTVKEFAPFGGFPGGVNLG